MTTLKFKVTESLISTKPLQVKREENMTSDSFKVVIFSRLKIKRYYYAPVTFFAILSLTWSCTKNLGGSSSLYTPSTANVTATATLVELQQGRTFYMNNCNSCHSLYSPDSYSPTQWKSIMGSMAPRTGMSASEILLVTKYVCMGKY